MAKQIFKSGLTTPNSFVTTTVDGSLQTTLLTDAVLYNSQLAQPDGVASLDENGKVPLDQIPSSLIGAVTYQGTWDASTNTPAITSGVGTKGFYYVVSVAGTTNIDGIADWQVGDWIIFDGDPITPKWQKVDNTEDVLSTVLTGLTPLPGPIVATDTILQAFGKTLNGITNAIPLAGTDPGAPVTGHIETDAGIEIGHLQNIIRFGLTSVYLSNTSGKYFLLDNNFTLGAFQYLTFGGTSQYNFLAGSGVGGSINDSTHNMFFGECISPSHTSASHNAGMGFGSGNVFHPSANYNVLLGNWSGITFGQASTSNGGSANLIAGSGSGNTFNGANNNVMMGSWGSNTFVSASSNLVVGTGGGNNFNSGANNNTQLGSFGSNTFNGSDNFVAGGGGGNTLGSSSVLLGNFGGMNMANNNIAIGNGGGASFINGASSNSILGYAGSPTTDASSYNSLIGYAGGTQLAGSNYNVILGNGGGISLTSSHENLIGASADGTSLLSSSYNSLLGDLGNADFNNFNYGIVAGSLAGIFSGDYHVLLGEVSVTGTLAGNNNVVIGAASALEMNGDDNLVMGVSGGTDVSSSRNRLIGDFTNLSVSGANNSVLGYVNIGSIAGTYNALIGYLNNPSIDVNSLRNVILGSHTNLVLNNVTDKVIVPNITYNGGSGNLGSLVNATLTASRNWTLPDNSGTIALLSDIPGTGNFVSGPASATDNAIVRFDFTTGKLIQNSGVLIDDNNNISGLGYIEVNDVAAPANPGAGKGRLYKKSGSGGLFWKPDAAGSEVDLTSGGSSATKRLYHFSMAGSASNTTGHMAKASIHQSNATQLLPTTHSTSSGLNNGDNDPFIILNNATIKTLRIKFAAAAVQTGTVGTTPTVKLRVYRVNFSDRTQLGSDIDIPINPSGVGTFNDLSGNAFQSAVATGLSIAVNAGDAIGVEFVNQSGTNDGINSISRLYAVMETEE